MREGKSHDDAHTRVVIVRWWLQLVQCTVFEDGQENLLYLLGMEIRRVRVLALLVEVRRMIGGRGSRVHGHGLRLDNVTVGVLFAVGGDGWGETAIVYHGAIRVLLRGLRSIGIGEAFGRIDSYRGWWRGWCCGMAGYLRLTLKELIDRGGDVGQVQGCVFASENRGWLIQVVGEADDRLRIIRSSPIAVSCLRAC